MKGLLSVAILIADIAAIVDCANSKRETSKKVMWILLVVLLPVVGVILYCLVGRNK